MQATAAAVQAFLPATRGATRPAGRRASTLRLVQQQQRQMVVLRALGGEWLAAAAAAAAGGTCLCSGVGCSAGLVCCRPTALFINVAPPGWRYQTAMSNKLQGLPPAEPLLPPPPLLLPPPADSTDKASKGGIKREEEPEE
jgi:hypothetical protein